MRMALTLLLVAACAGHEQAPEASTSARPRAVDTLPADVRLTIDTTRDQRPISPLIYGLNGHELAEDRPRAFTFRRLGGNRTSTYNWRNNASNAGHDYHHISDAYFGESDEPARFVVDFLRQTFREGAAGALVTVPLLERVARDKDGPVPEGEVARNTRFVPSEARSPQSGAVDANDVVYQDVFVALLEETFPQGRVAYSLDNEPGSWNVTHPRIHPSRVTYAEVVSRSVEYAEAIRRVAPRADIYGPASFGFAGWMRLAEAPDANNRDFVNVYLDAMAAAERRTGTRLLDVLDVHFYPSVHVDGQSVTHARSAAAADLRMQAPRSLYDAGYEEESWIVADFLHEGIRLLPRLQDTIRAHYPGTKLAITEYNYGGGDNISGAVAQADVLGAYGRHGVHAAALWPLWEQPTAFILAAFDLYRAPLDEAPFGALSVPAETSDLASVGVWASVDSESGRVTVMVIHRSRDELSIGLDIETEGTLGTARRVIVDGRSPRPRRGASVEGSGGHYRFTSRGPSVTHLAIH